MSYKGFTSVELKRPKQSKFDLSHEKKLSGRIGRLIPIFLSETMPNDTFRCRSEVLLRLAPLLAPIMHRINVYVHYFFVPNRLLWEDWETFITGGRLGEAVDTPPVPPHMNIGDILALGNDLLDTSSLADYMGVPTIPDADSASWGGERLDVLPFIAYQKIWMDYYRDRNYVPDATLTTPVVSGALDEATFEILLTMQQRAFEKDYFTSALPFVQRGSEVLMPLMGTGEVTYSTTSNYVRDDDTLPPGNRWIVSQYSSGATIGDSSSGTTPEALGRIENIDEVNLTSSEVSINDLRRAVRLQEWLERNALAGSRYTESIMAHFGRRTSDSRLQRAEYLGGGKVPVKISEVVTTAYSEDASAELIPPANMAGHGISSGKSNYFKYNCEEHGFVIGIMSVLPRTAYMQGMPRMFRERYDFLQYPWPTFAHLGEQEVYDFEIYADPTSLENSDAPVFGYQSRYAEWKYMQSTVHGDFRSNLDFWHLARKFSSQPALGQTFVEFEDTLQDRIFAVSEVDTLWCMIYNDVSVVRSLPYFGTPNL